MLLGLQKVVELFEGKTQLVTKIYESVTFLGESGRLDKSFSVLSVQSLNAKIKLLLQITVLTTLTMLLRLFRLSLLLSTDSRAGHLVGILLSLL